MTSIFWEILHLVIIIIMLKWATVLSFQQIEYKGILKDFNKADFDGIKHVLKHVNWQEVLVGEVEECWAALSVLFRMQL